MAALKDLDQRLTDIEGDVARVTAFVATLKAGNGGVVTQAELDALDGRMAKILADVKAIQ